MATAPERRRFARLPIPAQLSGRGLGQFQVRLLDLSPEGVRIEHTRPLPKRGLFFLDLPPALGGISLQGEPIWKQMLRRQQMANGKWAVIHHSGLRFTMLTPGQQRRLAAALEILKRGPEG